MKEFNFHDPFFAAQLLRRIGGKGAFFQEGRPFKDHAIDANVYENDKEYLVLAKVKNLSKEQISLSFQGPYLMIKIQDPAQENQDTGENSHLHGEFSERHEHGRGFESPHPFGNRPGFPNFHGCAPTRGEISHQFFSQEKKINLEMPVNTETVEAKMEDGILRIRIQKDETKSAKSINIA